MKPYTAWWVVAFALAGLAGTKDNTLIGCLLFILGGACLYLLWYLVLVMIRQIRSVLRGERP